MSVKCLDIDMLEDLIEAAQHSSRGRQHLNLHQNYSDQTQRLLNAILPNSYIRPHRHLLDPKPEFLVALSGGFTLLIFNDLGEVKNVVGFGSNRFKYNCFAVEISPEIWHTVIAHTTDAVLLEIKPGPFNPAAAKEYAPWAPEENTPHAQAYFASLLECI